MRAFASSCCFPAVSGQRSSDGEGVALVKCEYRPGFVDAVEEREERVVVALGDRIELVIVATRALDGQPEHRGAERVHAIDDVLGAKLFLDAAALVRLTVQPVEGGRDALLARCIRQKIASKLPEEKLIVGQVPVERANDPVAVRRHVAVDVGLIAIRVGVTREVEPVRRHALAVRRRGEVTIDGPRVGVCRSVGEERVDLGRSGRQARQVEREASQENLA